MIEMNSALAGLTRAVDGDKVAAQHMTHGWFLLGEAIVLHAVCDSVGRTRRGRKENPDATRK